jgi:hypothetical protein
MPVLTFTSVMKIINGNPYIHISAARARALKPGWRKPLPVLVRINGRPAMPWRINMMPMGTGSFYLYLHGSVRQASGTKVGDRVEVEARFDEDYKNGPMHPMPAWFRAGLAADPAAKRNWGALPPSRKKEVLRYLSRLKSVEARQRNLEKALRVLSGEKARFMARAWEHGK